MPARERWMESPVGWLRIVAEGGAVTELAFEEGPPRRADLSPDSSPDARGETAAPSRRSSGLRVGAPDRGSTGGDALLDEAVSQLRAWFDGERTGFDLPLRPAGTPFQRRVWSALREIPFGETRTYGDIARRLGAPAAVRAVGAANGRNPLAILVPCHRVIGADGALTGFAGGLERKRWLLAHERRVAARRSGQLALAPAAQRSLAFPGGGA